MEDRLKLVLKELLLGIGLYGIVSEVIVLLCTQDKVYASMGLLIGLTAAAGMAVHMQSVLEAAVDMGEAAAQKRVSRAYALRTAVVFFVMGVMYYFHIGSILTGFIGLMGLKVAAYIQPITDKYVSKKYKGKGR